MGRHLEELSWGKWVGVRAGKEAVRTRTGKSVRVNSCGWFYVFKFSSPFPAWSLDDEEGVGSKYEHEKMNYSVSSPLISGGQPGRAGSGHKSNSG